MVSHWSLSDSKFLQVSWTFVSIQADSKNAVDWMVSTCFSVCSYVANAVTGYFNQYFILLIGKIIEDYYSYYLLLWEFFTPALSDGFSQEFEWQQVPSSLQDSSKYSGRSQ